MADNIQSLLDKIQSEGVNKAESAAKKIVADAEREAAQIVAKAAAEAEAMKVQAEKAREALEKRAEGAIRQSARDVVLELSSELKRRMELIVKYNVTGAMTPDFMAKIVTELATAVKRDPERAGTADFAVLVPPALLGELEQRLAASLGADFHKNVRLFPQNDLAAGLKLGFEGTEVFFDFSASALTEMIAAYAGPRIRAILKAE